MKKTALIIILVGMFWGKLVGGVEAKTKISPSIWPTITEIPTATPVIKENITEVSNNIPIIEREVKWKGWNSISFLISKAVINGVPENTVILLMLLPLVATLTSVIHYVVGLSGYGIFIPTMMAVALLATGVTGGLVLFLVILAITLLSNWLLKRMRLHFWPARSITLLFVGLGTFGVMAGASLLKFFDVSKISIFPILFMILLTEEFVRTQLTKSKKEAMRLTVGTLILAIGGALTMGVRGVGEVVLKYPEAVILVVVIVNIIVGNYGGIRLTEIKRFKNAIRKK